MLSRIMSSSSTTKIRCARHQLKSAVSVDGLGGRDDGAQRQGDLEARAAVGRVLRGHRPAVCFHDRLDEIEAQAKAAVVADRCGAFEALEDAAQLRLGDAGTVVADLEQDLAAVLADGHPDRLAGAVFDRVCEQVRQRLLETKPVPRADDRPVGVDDDVAVGALAVGCSPSTRRLTQSTMSILLHASARSGRSRCARRRAAIPPGCASRSLLWAARCSLVATRCPDWSMRSLSVSSCSCSTVSGVFSSCAASDRNSSRSRIASSAFAEPQLLLLQPAAVGQIARHLGEADQLAVLGAQRGDHHVGPESRAVLAHAPALVLEPSVARRALQLALALAGAHRRRSS